MYTAALWEHASSSIQYMPEMVEFDTSTMCIGNIRSGRLIHGGDGGRAVGVGNVHMHEEEVGGGGKLVQQGEKILNDGRGLMRDLELSAYAKQFLGKRVPNNTLRSSKNGFKMLGQFILAIVNDESSSSKYADLAAMAVSDACATAPGDNDFERSVMSVLLCGRSACDGFDNAGLKRLRHFLIELCTRYVSPLTQKEVAPSIMLNYVRGVQRRIKELGLTINLFSDPIFADPVERLSPLLDNKFAQQQSEGQITKNHNILTIDDIRTIFGSEH